MNDRKDVHKIPVPHIPIGSLPKHIWRNETEEELVNPSSLGK